MAEATAEAAAAQEQAQNPPQAPQPEGDATDLTDYFTHVHRGDAPVEGEGNPEAAQQEAEAPAEAPKKRDERGRFLKKGEAEGAEEAAEEPAEAEATDTDTEEAEEEQKESFSATAYALRKERRKVDERLALMDSRLAEIEQREAAIKDAEALLNKDALAFAKSKGHSVRDLIEKAANEEDISPEQRAIRELTAQNEALAAKVGKILERDEQTAAQAQVIDDQRTIQTALDGTEDDEYTLCKRWGSERVAQVAHQRWEESGRSLTIDTIVDKIEDELAEELERLSPAAGDQPGERTEEASRPLPHRKRAVKSVKSEGSNTKPPSTLTNRTAASRASTEKPVSPEDRLARAAALLQYNE
jgi:hypothetical protein